MPSVGALTLSIKAETESLRADLDKATAKIKQFENQTKQSSAAVSSSFAKMQVGQNMAKGLLLASSAMRAFDKTTDETTKQALEGVAKIAAAFAMGGPVMGVVIAGLELWAMKQAEVAKKIKETQEQQRRLTDFRTDAAQTLESLMRADDTAVDKLNQRLKEQEDIIEPLRSKIRVSEMFGGNASQRATVEAELRDRLRIIDALREQMKMEQALESLRVAGLGRGKEIDALRMEAAGVPTGEVGLLQQIEEYETKIAALRDIGTDAARRQVRELALQLDGTRELLDLTREINSSKTNEAIRKEIEMRSAITDEMRKQVEMQQTMSEWAKRGASPELMQALKAATLRAEAVREWRPFFQTIESGLTDAIVDGITTGFKNGTDIAKRIVDSLLSQLIGSMVSAGMNALVGGLFGGGGGGIGGIASLAAPLLGAATGGGSGAVLPLPDT